MKKQKAALTRRFFILKKSVILPDASTFCWCYFTGGLPGLAITVAN